MSADAYNTGSSLPISVARMNLVDSHSALASVGASGPMCLICEPRQASAWSIRFHAVNAGGQIGDMVASLEA